MRALMKHTVNTMESKFQPVISNVKEHINNLTVHGFGTILQEENNRDRRYIWILVMVSACSLFMYAMFNMVNNFNSSPSNIELVIQQQAHIPFPSVTICNQNPYRLSTLARYGMYDVMIDAFSKHSEKAEYSVSDTYMMNPVVCSLPRDVVYVMVHNNVSVSVCKDICSYHISGKCSGFKFDMGKKSCTITSYTGEDRLWYTEQEIAMATENCQKQKVFFYRRLRLTDDRTIHCNFENSGDEIYTDDCRLVPVNISDVSERWVKVSGPDDTPFLKSNGHYLKMTAVYKIPGIKAKIRTDFLNTTSKCMQISTGLRTELQVILIGEDLKVNHITFTIEYGSEWNKLHAELPDGLHQIAIEGLYNKVEYSNDVFTHWWLDIFSEYYPQLTANDPIDRQSRIDEIKIAACTEWMCTDYNCGSSECLPLDRVCDGYVDCADGSDETHCEIGPTCHTEWEAHTNKFACITGPVFPATLHECRQTCLHSSRTCHGFCHYFQQCLLQFEVMIHITDTTFEFSDLLVTYVRHIKCPESSPSKQSFGCNFEDSVCLYKQLSHNTGLKWLNYFDWMASDGRCASNQANTLMLVPSTNHITGESATIISPLTNWPENKKVIIRMKPLKQLHNKIHVWLIGSLGITKHPLFTNMETNSEIMASGKNGVRNINYMDVNVTDVWIDVSFCVPGGPNISQGLIIHAEYAGLADDFIIDSIKITGDECSEMDDHSYQRGFHKVQENFTCSFEEENQCGFTSYSEHTHLTWKHVPKQFASKIMKHFTDNIIATTLGCAQCQRIETYGNTTSLHINTSHADPFHEVLFESNYVIYDSHGSMYFSDENIKYHTLIVTWRIEIPTGGIRLNCTNQHGGGSLKIGVRIYNDNGECIGEEKVVNGSVYVEGNVVDVRLHLDNVRYCDMYCEYQHTSTEHTEYTAALMYNGEFSERPYSSQLILPLFSTERQMCLTFEYMKQLSPLIITRNDTIGSSEVIYQDDVISHRYEWRNVTVKIKPKPGHTFVIFHTHKTTDGYAEYPLFIDDVLLTACSGCLQTEYTCATGDCVPGADGDWDPVNYCVTFESGCQPLFQFHCVSGECVDKYLGLCGGIWLCKDGSEKANCTCFDGNFECGSGGCIQQSEVCDGFRQCQDASDEAGCSHNIVCRDNEFECESGGCVPLTVKCDGTPQCMDGSDENMCSCTYTEFQCHSGECVPIYWRCNDKPDCRDSSDEINCDCDLGQFVCHSSECIPWNKRCDAVTDCADASDELMCACISNEFSCLSGGCLPLTWRCDGWVTCADGSDEAITNDAFECTSGGCTPYFFRCDGKPDCDDKSDEVNCTSGFINSPNYPEEYDNNIDAMTWNIEVEAESVILLTFHFVSVDLQFIKCDDTLKIYDGPNIDAPLLGTVCGFATPLPILSTGNELSLVFSTNEHFTYHGWSLSWKSVDQDAFRCASDGHVFSSVGCYGSACDDKYDNPVNCHMLSSPNFPDEYDNYMRGIVWTIYADTVDTRSVIVLTFDYFSVDDGCRQIAHCPCDDLKIYDGSNNLAPLLAILCGDVIPDPVRGSGNQITLEFHTDRTRTSFGWKLQWKTQDPAYPAQWCMDPNDITTYYATQTTQYIVSHPEFNGITHYESDTTRCYVIHKEQYGDNYTLVINNVYFELEYHANCYYDYVQLYVQQEGVAVSITDKICGSGEEFSSVEVTSNKVFIYFESNAIINFLGFALSYSIFPDFTQYPTKWCTDLNKMELNYGTLYEGNAYYHLDTYGVAHYESPLIDESNGIKMHYATLNEGHIYYQPYIDGVTHYESYTRQCHIIHMDHSQFGENSQLFISQYYLAPAFDTACSYDYVQLYVDDNGVAVNITDRMCGTGQSFSSLLVSQSRVYIYFQSDAPESGTGFAFMYMVHLGNGNLTTTVNNTTASQILVPTELPVSIGNKHLNTNSTDVRDIISEESLTVTQHADYDLIMTKNKITVDVKTSTDVERLINSTQMPTLEKGYIMTETDNVKRSTKSEDFNTYNSQYHGMDTTTLNRSNREQDFQDEKLHSKIITDLYWTEGQVNEYLVKMFDTKLNDFINESSHQMSDVLLRCEWQGTPCNSSFWTKTMTDMGKCLTFNAGGISEGLKAPKSGTENGLQLVLNIEKEEYVDQMMKNNGIKIQLHDEGELPLMLSSGYSLNPGTNTVFKLKYEKNHFLKPDYGTCGIRELELYPNISYSNSHCLRQCETLQISDACNCNMPYMPDINGVSKCTLDDYLQCVVGLQSVASQMECGCPMECYRVNFLAELSYSSFVTDNILDNNIQTLNQKHGEVLNLKHRLNKNSYVHFLNSVKIILENIQSLDYFHNIHTMYVRTIVKESVETIFNETLIFLPDLALNKSFVSISSSEFVGLGFERGINEVIDQYAKDYVSKNNAAERLLNGEFESTLEYITESVKIMRISELEKATNRKLYNAINNLEDSLMASYLEIFEKYQNNPIGLSELIPLVKILRVPSFDSDSMQYSFQYTMPEFASKIGSEQFVYHDEEILKLIYSSNGFSKLFARYVKLNKKKQKVLIEKFITSELRSVVDEYISTRAKLENTLLQNIKVLQGSLREFQEEVKIGDNYMRNNLVQLGIYFEEMKERELIQTIGYSLGDFFGYFGGYMGLLLGASIFTIIELLDLLIFKICLQLQTTRKL